MDPLARFERWLKGAVPPYRPSTVRALVRDVRTLVQYGCAPVSPSRRRIGALRRAWRLWNEFCLETDGVPTRIPEPQASARRFDPKRPTELMTADEWARLRTAIQSDRTTVGRVLDVMAVTGLRVGDVLRTTTAEIDAGLEHPEGLTTIRTKGTGEGGKATVISLLGAPDEWIALRKRMGPPKQTVAQALIGPTGTDLPGEAAYQKCRRRLQRHAKAANVHKRIRLHAIRHHVAAQLREAEGDQAVQDVLGHESMKTSARYGRDVTQKQLERARRVAQLQRKIRGE